VTSGIPGIVCQLPNSHVEALLSPEWCRLLAEIGKGGDLIMADLLLECAIFIPTTQGGGFDRGNYYQLNGMVYILVEYNNSSYYVPRVTSINNC
jgi:telomerase reverse transcriptase